MGVVRLIEDTGAVVMGRRSYDMGDTEAGYVDYEHQRLERIKVVDSPGRTDIRYRVVR